MAFPRAVSINRRIVFCSVLSVLFALGVGAQSVISGRASVSASHTEKVKKTKDGDFTFMDVEGKDTFKVSATFNLAGAPANWESMVDGVSVSAGGVSLSPDIVKSKAKGGSAKIKEKDKETRSSTTCTVKWSKKSVTLSLSGTNYDDDNIVAPDEDSGNISEDIEITLDLGSITCEAVVNVKGKGSITTKTVRSGRGADAETDDYDLFNWRASGSGRTASASFSVVGPRALVTR